MCAIVYGEGCFGGLKTFVGAAEVRSWARLGLRVVSEFIGAFFLVLIGCGSTSAAARDAYRAANMHTGLSFGLVVAFTVQYTWLWSVGLANPAVLSGLVAGGYVPARRALLCAAGQCGGAAAGAYALQALLPPSAASYVGQTSVSSHLTSCQAFFVEASTSFILVLTVCEAYISGNERIAASFSIGATVTACQIFAVPFTGASMNPARSLGPAMVTDTWDNYWVYLAGPTCGGVAAGAVHRSLFRPCRQQDDLAPRAVQRHQASGLRRTLQRIQITSTHLVTP